MDDTLMRWSNCHGFRPHLTTLMKAKSSVGKREEIG